MKLFDIKVFTSNRAYDVTLRNLTIIRASQIVHRIGVMGETLLRAVKRLLVPGKLVIQPLIKIRSLKRMKQGGNISLGASMLLRSRKRVTVSDPLRVKTGVNVRSIKKMRESHAWRVVTEILLGAMKPFPGSSTLMVDADMLFQKVRKRRLGEVSLVRLVDMEPLTLDELDYIVED